MKKIFALTILMAAALAASAQNNYYPLNDQPTFQELMRSGVILILIYLITTFILTMVKLFLDDRLKKKIVEAGTPDTVVAQLMPAAKNEKKSALKWFCVLTAAAIGLAVTAFYQPGGIYTLVIMTFSLAIGFLGYFFLIRRLYN